MVAKRRLLSSFVILERKSSQIIAKVSDKCRTWFVMRIGDMGSHHCDHRISGTCQLLLPDWAFRPSLREVPDSQKKEPKRGVKQRASLQSALEKFINIRADNPEQGEDLNNSNSLFEIRT
jgi:hypothetical protein